MRAFPLSVLMLCGMLATPALAQQAASTGASTGASTDSGARPGNDVGTGMSLPMGSHASNIAPRDTQSAIAPNLKGPDLGPDATASDYLRSARGALAAGRTGETQQALEMAQTRLLDRSVPYGQTNDPSADPAVAGIRQALGALASGDRARCLAMIDATLPIAH